MAQQSPYKSNFGLIGQNHVEKFLATKGYKLLAKNFSTRLGELDLVMHKDDTVCFIEVKTRSQKYFPISSCVTLSKQRRIAKTATQFALQHKLQDKVLRFDIATVLFQNAGQQPNIEYLPNAFCVSW